MEDYECLIEKHLGKLDDNGYSLMLFEEYKTKFDELKSELE